MIVVTLGFFVIITERSKSELFSRGVYYFYNIAFCKGNLKQLRFFWLVPKILREEYQFNRDVAVGIIMQERDVFTSPSCSFTAGSWSQAHHHHHQDMLSSMDNGKHSQHLFLELLVCLTVHWIRGKPVLQVSRTFHGSIGYTRLRPFIWVNEEQISTCCLTRGLGECLCFCEKSQADRT